MFYRRCLKLAPGGKPTVHDVVKPISTKKQALIFVAAIMLTIVFAFASLGCSEDSVNAREAIVGEWTLARINSNSGSVDCPPELQLGTATAESDRSITITPNTSSFDHEMPGIWEAVPKSDWPDLDFDLIGYYEVHFTYMGSYDEYVGAVSRERDGNYYLFLILVNDPDTGFVFMRTP